MFTQRVITLNRVWGLKRLITTMISVINMSFAIWRPAVVTVNQTGSSVSRVYYPPAYLKVHM